MSNLGWESDPTSTTTEFGTINPDQEHTREPALIQRFFPHPDGSITTASYHPETMEQVTPHELYVRPASSTAVVPVLNEVHYVEDLSGKYSIQLGGTVGGPHPIDAMAHALTGHNIGIGYATTTQDPSDEYIYAEVTHDSHDEDGEPYSVEYAPAKSPGRSKRRAAAQAPSNYEQPEETVLPRRPVNRKLLVALAAPLILLIAGDVGDYAGRNVVGNVSSYFSHPTHWGNSKYIKDYGNIKNPLAVMQDFGRI